jgi:hypothetical protein
MDYIVDFLAAIGVVAVFDVLFFRGGIGLFLSGYLGIRHG